jgi:hypothetical protein
MLADTGMRVNLEGKGGWRDLPEVSGSNERAEGPYLPQAAQVEVPEMRENSDATAELTRCHFAEPTVRARRDWKAQVYGQLSIRS